jgi:hypothetical protein
MPVCQLIINKWIRRRVRALPKDGIVCNTKRAPCRSKRQQPTKPAAASDAAHLSHAVVVHLMFGKGFPLQHRRGGGWLDVKYLTGTSSYREVG